MATEQAGKSEYVSVEASEFAAKCLQLVDEVAAGGAVVVITKDGHPVSQLVPCAESVPTTAAGGAMTMSFFGADKGRMRILGDIISPPDDIDWDEWADEQVETFYKDLGR